MVGEQGRVDSGKIISNFLDQARRYLLEAFFPLECVGCRREGEAACAECLATVPFYVEKWEKVTAVPWGLSPRDSCAVDNFVVGYSYSQPVVKGIIRGLKFRSLMALRSPLELLARRAVLKYRVWLLEDRPLAVVPVPSADARLRERGLDPVSWIARAVADDLNLPVMHLLEAQDHERQSRLGNDARRKRNIHGAFQAFTAAPERVLLVDDVLTSGATSREAIRVLSAAGAKKVRFFGFARAIKKQHKSLEL